MKKLLTILTSCSFGFLITTSIILVNKNNGENNIISYNAQTNTKKHVVAGSGLNRKITKIGYYKKNGKTIISQIPPTVSTIAADLPPEITSLEYAFTGNNQYVKWETKWNTSNIEDMSYVFYNTNYINDPSIAEWDVSKVKTMEGMFGKSRSFNQDLSKWDVSNVKNFKGMFSEATDFNNKEKHLNWDDKLKNATNMESMFKNASSFTHDLSGWKLTNYANNKDFGLDDKKQPKWVTKPVEAPTPNIQPRSEDESNTTIPDTTATTPIIKPDNTPSQPDPMINTPSKENESSIINQPVEEPKLPIEKSESPESKNEITEVDDTLKIDNENSIDRTNNNTNQFPLIKPNTVISKSKSNNALVITGAVLGTFTVLGIGAGTGYYYRKNLKNFYSRSTDKIKEKISRIKSKK
ncbi:BspA family leucine-rich repeat surface protein [Mycoplasma mycoides]|uniref:BspA family leucine-rich repeat surface protein n=1 Tax=Mycoplasma mycoides TaxID=2102 RepID=UPI0027353230|nr:BspA family leucine-rich repeat surface protein [Mycoplasma mycoides]MDP4040806.1 BspA family leucine-rich repeat surface protein [Mycoplasma mycoides]MDP4041699.1 BspA family leucine-rich repeat surface protein [Mycoplasma mycoides]MDP4042567.1 BspA family leucine-rich repeat surface protein [Mycoplasma mycoides]MDP4044032.1 BspA family leucine-rich repeat surface protein [Mycoplasma mycoides]MDP4044646.1 BspA family leucine-rich repeat surface protein [Mycoplasma mycoides]